MPLGFEIDNVEINLYAKEKCSNNKNVSCLFDFNSWHRMKPDGNEMRTWTLNLSFETISRNHTNLS